MLSSGLIHGPPNADQPALGQVEITRPSRFAFAQRVREQLVPAAREECRRIVVRFMSNIAENDPADAVARHCLEVFANAVTVDLPVHPVPEYPRPGRIGRVSEIRRAERPPRPLPPDSTIKTTIRAMILAPRAIAMRTELLFVASRSPRFIPASGNQAVRKPRPVCQGISLPDTSHVSQWDGFLGSQRCGNSANSTTSG